MLRPPAPWFRAAIASCLAGFRRIASHLSQPGWAPLLILGPVTGGLTALCVFNLRKRRPVCAACCIAGIVAFWILAPALLRSELIYIHAHDAGLFGHASPSVAVIAPRTG